MTTFHQVIARAGPGDAITNLALQTSIELGRLGPSEVFAGFVEASADPCVRTLHDLPTGRPTDVVIYHSSSDDPEMTNALLRRPEQLVLMCHGAAPTDVAALRHRVAVAIADSELGANELAQLGYTGVHVALARCGGLASLPTDVETLRDLHSAVGVPYVLDTSELLPHECQHVLLQALHVLQSVHRVELGLVLAGPASSASYARSLRELTRRLRLQHVWFASPQSDASIATIHRGARVFSSASENDRRLALDALEAMSFGVPTIVRETGATADTVGRGALVLPATSGPLMFAEAILMTDQDDRFRSALIDSGFERFTEYSMANSGKSVADVIEAAGLAS